MADPAVEQDDRRETDTRPNRKPTTRAPRWVKVSGVVALVVIALLVVLMVVGGDEHGPGRHSRSDSGDTTSATAHTAPEGSHEPG